MRTALTRRFSSSGRKPSSVKTPDTCLDTAAAEILASAPTGLIRPPGGAGPLGAGREGR